MYVKVLCAEPEKTAHLWNYENFREAHNAEVIDWNVDGLFIHYIIYRVDGDIDDKVIEENGLKYKVLRLKDEKIE